MSFPEGLRKLSAPLTSAKLIVGAASALIASVFFLGVAFQMNNDRISANEKDIREMKADVQWLLRHTLEPADNGKENDDDSRD